MLPCWENSWVKREAGLLWSKACKWSAIGRMFPLLVLLSVSPNAMADTLAGFSKQYANEFANELRQHSIPGAAFVVVKDDQVVALKTFGHTDKAKTRKVDGNTVFRLASVSKTFAATLATLLAQEKQLDLSDSVTKFVPQFELAHKGAADKIQLKHLLSHSSGLVPNAYDNLLHENWSMEKIIGRFNRVKPICKPDQCYGYQNIAFGFIQPAIESSQNKSYSALLQERVFTPLKMNNASVGIEVFEQSQNTAKPHILRKRTKTGRKDKRGDPIYKYKWRTVKVKPDFYKVEPAAGVNASINDMAKWLIANLGNNPDVLPPEVLAQMTKARVKTRKDMRRSYWRDHLTNAHYGYGWRIYEFEGQPIIYHSGWVAGFVAEIGYAPHLDVGFAMLLNAESRFISKMSTRFWSQAYRLGSAKTKSANFEAKADSLRAD